MKVIFNQNIIEDYKLSIDYSSRKNLFSGDFINGFCWFFQDRLLFWEDVYFQLMASMRKMRIPIPLSYTPELFEKQIYLLAQELKITKGRIKLTIFRNNSGNTPDSIVEFLPYKDFFSVSENEIDIYKEITIFPNLLSGIHIFHPANIITQQFAEENNLQELLLLNNEKRIARTISGNIFLIQDNIIYSNPVEEGAFISVLKKNFIHFLRKKTEFIYKEEKLSPFQTQSAQEIFLLSDETGITPVTRMRKTSFITDIIYSLSKRFTGFALSFSTDQ